MFERFRKPKNLSSLSQDAQIGGGAPATIEAFEAAISPFKTGKNKYQSYIEFMKMDPIVNNCVTRLALLGQYAYKGITIHTDTTPSNSEKELLKKAKIAAKDLFDFRSLFFTLSKACLRDGDACFVTNAEDNAGITQVQHLPTTRLTIVGEESQIEDKKAIILKEKYYLLNEFEKEKRQRFPENDKQKIFHVSIDNQASEIHDIAGRTTFGIWSESPLECLKSRILWKQAILITDVLWRYRNVPREVHELDTSMFVPEKFSGTTWEEQVRNAATAAQNYLKEYATQITKKKVDQGYVVGSNVKRIYYVEPTKVAYTSPNDVVDQIDKTLKEGIGAYSVGQGTYATELVIASYVVLMPDFLAYRISNTLLALLRYHLQKKYNTPDEDLEKLDIKLSLVLDILKGELVRQSAVMAATGAYTYDEIRFHTGYDALTDDQIQRLVQIAAQGRQGQNSQTIFDILRNSNVQTEPTEPITPQSKRQKQET